MPRDAGPQPGSSLDEIGAVMDAEDTVESRREDSLTPSAESPKRNIRWFLIGAALLIVLCILFWLLNRLN